MTIRRLAVSALAPMTHGLDTLILGPKNDGAPEFVVVVEPPGPPTHEEFGRIVAVKPCDDATMFSRLAVPEGVRLETLGLAGTLAADLSEALARTSFSRICPFGEMQRPPFGYRPQIDAFA